MCRTKTCSVYTHKLDRCIRHEKETPISCLRAPWDGGGLRETQALTVVFEAFNEHAYVAYTHTFKKSHFSCEVIHMKQRRTSLPADTEQKVEISVHVGGDSSVSTTAINLFIDLTASACGQK